MRDFRVYIGYNECTEPEVVLRDEQVLITDADGAVLWDDLDDIAEFLNERKFTVILPWMGDRRLIRNEDSKWFIEERTD